MFQYIIFPFAALAVWTASNTIIKGLTSKINPNIVSMIIVGSGILPMLISIMMSPVHSFSIFLIVMSVFSGIFLGLGYILFYKSLRGANLGNAAVTINVQQIVVILFGLSILREKLTSLILPGIILIIFGSILVTVTRGFKVDKVLLIAAAANIIWGIYYIPLTFAIASVHSSPVPLLLSRIIGFFSVFIIFNIRQIINGIKMKISKNNIRTDHIAFMIILISIIAGILDGSGNVLYAFSIQYGILVIAGAIIAMLPVSLALSGRIVYHEKLRLRQYTGIALSVLGAIIIVI
ncbi:MULTISPECIES: EamA family transporter [Acidiplasma]|uniref:EamA domain-containing protein n=1 Tax=Acidiplasma aeolicum TaxID=507754 RepID=A0A0Q0WGR5_9ARCH|nr:MULTISPECIES: EamA family transporter [Acidiplasma]KJE48646.1 hypothetical protein TZ01_08350 [Acidiplasma sp. MBA-1]KQB34645.1 hypothetical protein AOG54_04165 [Acidiplasma aeolicum]WMT55402.1 MAG: EamA family transporter [Acidiplasma sp.]